MQLTKHLYFKKKSTTTDKPPLMQTFHQISENWFNTHTVLHFPKTHRNQERSQKTQTNFPFF